MALVDGRIAPRSGLAVKHFIDTGAGVIDADYRGQVKVLLFNHADADFEIKEGDRIAQLVLERIYTPEVMEVQDLEATLRGAGGFREHRAQLRWKDMVLAVSGRGEVGVEGGGGRFIDHVGMWRYTLVCCVRSTGNKAAACL